MIRWFSKVVFKCNLIRKIKLRNSPLLNFQWMSKNLKNQMFSDVTIQSHPNIKSVLFNERKETHKHVNLHRERDGGRGKKQNWKTTLPFARCYSDSDAMTKLLSWQFMVCFWFGVISGFVGGDSVKSYKGETTGVLDKGRRVGALFQLVVTCML